MPQLSDRFGPIHQTATLDGSGAGTVSFQPNGSNARITNLFVKVSSTTNQATCTLYKGQIADGNRINNTNSGSTGAALTGQIDLFDGETLYVVWTGGDAGSTATATFVGITIPFSDISASVTEWADPIAAGDGSLIFPSLKSPNYVANVSGWKIGRDGSVEFNDAVIRGEVLAGNGSVRLNDSGIHVEDINGIYQYDINTNGGFIARNVPDDGETVQMAPYALFLRGETPTPINGLGQNYGYVAARVSNPSGSIETPYLVVKAPSLSGKDSPEFRMYGQSSDSSWNNRKTQFDGFVDKPMGNLMTYGELNPTNGGSFPGIGAEAVLIAGYSNTYPKNSVFYVKIVGQFQPAISSTGPSGRVFFRTRKGTTTAGSQLYISGRLGAITAEPYAVNLSGWFRTSTNDVTTQLCVTAASGSAAGANDITILGTANNIFRWEVWYMGDGSSTYGSYVALT